jgi:radical SAM superfamily enzyme YgiQ (UPF0313 family)
MSREKIKILRVNPNIEVYKNHIDYPYFINLNLYLNLWFLLENFKEDIDLDIFDAFISNSPSVYKKEDYFVFWSEFETSKYSENYDYIVINFSPFILYNSENISWINNLTQQSPNAKIIFLNSYSGGFCYIDYNENHLKSKWLKLDYLLNWNTESKLAEILGLEKLSKKQNHLKYSLFDKIIDLSHYFSFLSKVSSFGLLDFYKIEENSLPFYTSKWCIFNCNFCTSNNAWVKWYFWYDILELEQEIIYLKGKYKVKKLIILDALFNKDKDFTNKVLDLFIKYEIKIEIPNWLRLDLLNEEMIEKLSQVLSSLSISIETGNKNVSDNIIGKWLNFNKIDEVCNLAWKYNINLVSHYIIWFPEETKKEINDTLELAYRLYIDYDVFPLLQFATPLPWTRLWEKSSIDLYNINLFEKFQTDYLLKSDNFTKEDLIIFRENFYKKIEVSKTKKIIINLTYACQNNCVFCATWDRYKLSQDFSYVIANLIKYYKKWVKLLDLDWWEPTLYKDLIRVVKIAKKIGYRYINLTSSGRKYKDIDFLESILVSGVDSILVSLHGTSEKIHDEITRKTWSFDETILGLDNILLLKAKYNFNFGINITLCKINEDNFSDYLHFIEKWKPDIVNVQFLTPFGNAENLADLEQNIEKCSSILKEEISKLSYSINIINLPFCYMKWHEDKVSWDIWKMERDMLFVGEKPSNLYDYLAVERERKEKCNTCDYKIVCDWFYKF